MEPRVAAYSWLNLLAFRISESREIVPVAGRDVMPQMGKVMGDIREKKASENTWPAGTGLTRYLQE
jgi:hypothetical protein